MDHNIFLVKFGAVFEHSPWVAEAVFENGGGESGDAESLCARFESAFLASDPALQLVTLKAHPQLACAMANPVDLTTSSVSEQTSAGLNQCSPTELAEFARLNKIYREKFGFPFIIAVRGRGRLEILDVFRERLNNDLSLEYKTALRQVCQIGCYRIRDILDD